MFKKQLKISQTTLLSGKDIKKLKQDLSKNYDKSSIEYMFQQNQKIQLSKHQGTKIQIYSLEDGCPIFVDPTSKGDYFPTVFTLQAYPQFTPKICLNEGVENYIFNGANLMWPGVQNIKELKQVGFKSDDVHAILNSQGKVIAIGAMACNSEDVTQETQQGQACFILHHLKDTLSEIGPKEELKVVFKEQQEEMKNEEISLIQQQDKQQINIQDDNKVDNSEKKEQNKEKQQMDQEGNDVDVEDDDDEEEEDNQDQQLAQYMNITKNQNKEVQKIEKVDAQKFIEEIDLDNFNNQKKKKGKLKKGKADEEDNELKEKKEINTKKKGDDNQKEKDNKKESKKDKTNKKKNEDVVDQELSKEKDKGKKVKKDDNKHNKKKIDEDDNQNDDEIRKIDEQKNDDKEQKKQKKSKSKNKKDQNDDLIETQGQDDNNKNEKEKKEKENYNDENDKEEGNQSNDEDLQQGDNQTQIITPQIPPQVMDEYIRQAFLNALKISINDKQLPIDPSLFYSNHMIPCKPENITLDFKNSSYKKIGKFIQTMVKEQFIEYKEGKKGAAPMITKICRQNQKYQDWEPTIKNPNRKKDQDDEECKKSDQQFKINIIVEELYKPTSSVMKIFGGEQSLQQYLSSQQIIDSINNYVKSNCKMEKKNVIPDELITQLIELDKIKQQKMLEEKEKNQQQVDYPDDEEDNDFKQKEKQLKSKQVDIDEQDQQNEGQETLEKKSKKRENKTEFNILSKDQIWKLVEPHMLNYHKITYLSGQKKTEIKMGQFKGISLVAEKNHNKNITTITGLEEFELNFDDLSKEFNQQLACAVSTHELPGKNAGKALIVHGNFLQELSDFFCNKCQINPRYIHQQNKLEGKKKKLGFQK